MKNLDNLIYKYVDSCFTKGVLKEKEVARILEIFKNEKSSKALIYLKLFYKALNRVMDQTTLVIESSVELTSNEVNAIFAKVKKQFRVTNTKVIVNKNLLGGLKLRIGDFLIDDSVKGRVEALRERIIT